MISQLMEYHTTLTSYELLLECRDQAMKKVVSLVNKCANGRAILLLGENGTGKEVVARALHEQGDRKHKPLVVLDCTNLGGDTLRSELFGHEKGAFTGATEQRLGLFERAHEGTAFLDEIGEVPLDDQPKLLRVLQEGTFQRMGGNRQITSKFRLIAATNKDLPRMVQQGTFRQDLYYRIQTFTIPIPPLRERMEDVIRLANHFVDSLSGNKKRLHSDTEAVLRTHSWPGNVRELKNAMERGVAFSEDREAIMPEDLCLTPVVAVPANFNSRLSAQDRDLVFTQVMEDLIEAIRRMPSDEVLRAGGLMAYIEKLTIEAVLRLNRGNILKSALQLVLGRQTIYNKMRKYGIGRWAQEERPSLDEQLPPVWQQPDTSPAETGPPQGPPSLQ
jgi:transcriptional regulator with GAF, ATPase, and Fis domain